MSDLSSKRFDIYANVIIAFAIGLVTLTPIEMLPTGFGSDKLYHCISCALLALPIAILRPIAG